MSIEPIAPASALICYNAASAPAFDLAERLRVGLGSRHPLRALDDATTALGSPAPGVVVTVGGDGTLLRAARLAAQAGVPLLGVNMGRLGFLTEVEASEATDLVPRYLAGEVPGGVWADRRAMLQAVVRTATGEHPPVDVLNDVVVGRGALAHLARISVTVDGAELTTYQADAVIVATATGSTAYALSAGGPILHPALADTVLVPVAAHGDLDAPVVVPREAVVELEVMSEHPSIASADGITEVPLGPGDRVRVSTSPHEAVFLRAGAPARFYETLVYRLRRGADQSVRLARLMAEEEARRGR